MMYVHEPGRRIQVIRRVDVLVVGGGPAGFGAAVASARNGAATLVVERYGFLGGMFTAGLVRWLPTDKLVPLEAYGETRPLQGGIVTELLDRLLVVGGAISPSVSEPVSGSGIYFPTDPEMAKVILIQMLDEAGVETLLHALAVGTITAGNRVSGIIIESKSGRQAILAEVVIDASGDADIAAYAGSDYEKAPEPLTMTLQGFVANVDCARAKEMSGTKNLDWFNRLVNNAVEQGELIVGEKRVLPELPPTKLMPLSVLDPERIPANWLRHGEVSGWLESTLGDATDVFDLTRAELVTRKNLLSILSFYRKYMPGYENAYLSSTGAQVGIRESRRVRGEYYLTADRDIRQGLTHADAIVKCRAGDVCSPETYTPQRFPVFDIPYRCLVPKTTEGLLVAGRCISIDHKSASFLSPRDISTCICVGQAAGTAAALSVQRHVWPRGVSVSDLRGTLRKQGANL